MFAREGYALIAGSAVIGLIVVASALWFLDAWMVRGPVLVLGVGVFAFTAYFFRDPDRSPPGSALEGATFLAPADGKVVEVVEEEEPLYLGGPSKRVSIFLSPLNVHVNRVPSNGVVEYVRYVPGDYLVAWHPKASEKNERSEIGMRHESGTPILFKQIAGAVARRIVYHVKEGDAVTAGERFGIVKFGSRMDVHVPPHVPLDVEVGQTVRAGETVIGAFPDESAAAHDEVRDDTHAAPRNA
jgi:phosphatidylserine decarboxylase